MGKEKNEVVADMPPEKKVVEVEYNGTGGWALDFAGKGKKILGPGETIALSIHDKQELHALLQIIKQVNTPRVNRCSYLDKQDKATPHKYRDRFKILSGLEYLPKVLQKLSFQQNSLPTDEEAKAVVSLVPDYYQKEEKLYKVQR